MNRNDHLESDLSEFMILKNRHAKTTGRPLDKDPLIVLLMQKTVGPLQRHLRLNVRRINRSSTRSMKHWKLFISTTRAGM